MLMRLLKITVERILLRGPTTPGTPTLKEHTEDAAGEPGDYIKETNKQTNKQKGKGTIRQEGY